MIFFDKSKLIMTKVNNQFTTYPHALYFKTQVLDPSTLSSSLQYYNNGYNFNAKTVMIT